MMLRSVAFIWLVAMVHSREESSRHHVKGRANTQTAASEEPAVHPECTCVPHHQCNNSKGQGRKVESKDALAVHQNCKDDEVCCQLEDLKPPPKKPKCGHRPMEDLVSAMAQSSDNQALYGEFPWMVAVMGQQYINGGHQTGAYYCGGSLIRPDVVLTAAHCVKGKKYITIRAGEWSVRNLELYPVQNVKVKHVTVHEEYFAEKLHNDIALLFLESPVDLMASVATVCLPSQGENFDNNTCMASGWGKDVFGPAGQYQDIMKKVRMSVIPQSHCEEQLRSTKLETDFQLHDSSICALGLHGRDLCQGDGGSPLVCPTAGTTGASSYVQAGVVSWGLGCGGDSPSVYTNVAHFRNWIDHELASSILEL
uniref:Phenoloxidase-activating factor 2 n=1 Tax=Graphocephala atropunctata TaxID=36148 RepID=A0A1B6KF59_9HEMI